MASEDQCALIWRNFEKSMCIASRHSEAADGYVGEQLTQVTKLMFDLTSELCDNWSDAWEEGAGDRPLVDRQRDASIVFREHRKALTLILSIFDIRQKAQRLTEMEKLWDDKTLNTKKSSGEDATSIVSKPRTEIKEEPLEFEEQPTSSNATAPVLFETTNDDVKDEPVDVKEEPIVDVFCPSTGDARPFNHLNLLHNEEMESEDALDALINGVVKDEMQLASKPRIPCSLCGVYPLQGFATPPEPKARAAFLKCVIMRSDQERARIAELMRNYDHAYFCESHVSSRQGKRPADHVTDAVVVSGKRENCYLCGMLSTRCCPTPARSSLRTQFLRRIRMTTKEQVARVRSLSRNNELVFFCIDHVMSLADQRITPRTCDLCGHMAFPYITSPRDDPWFFFDNLVGLNPEQLKKVQSFIANKRQATICRKHYKEKTRLPSSCDAPPSKRQRVARQEMPTPDASKVRFRTVKDAAGRIRLQKIVPKEERGPSSSNEIKSPVHSSI